MSVDVSNAVAVQRFRRELGSLWAQVGPLCRPGGDAAALQGTLRAAQETAPALLPDLEALLAGWEHYDAAQRAVLTGAVAFVVEDDPAAQPLDRLVEDEKVVRAAVKAVLRHR